MPTHMWICSGRFWYTNMQVVAYHMSRVHNQTPHLYDTSHFFIFYSPTIILMKTNRIVFFLSLLGILMAIYVLQSFLRQAPIVCVSGGCETVRKHPASYPLGIPVPLFGLVGYTILALTAFIKTFPHKASVQTMLSRVMRYVSLFGVLFVTWFTYTEITVIKAICMWCAISGINMVVVLVLLHATKERTTHEATK